MKSCTFFGHRECPDTIRVNLREVLIELINQQGVEMFYVGNQGQFDAMVRRTLRELQAEYPYINYAVVLAYMPGKSTQHEGDSDTMLPEGIESIHPRYAIAWRNHWMLERSDYVVTYIIHAWGGAAKYRDKALMGQKHVINIGEKRDTGML